MKIDLKKDYRKILNIPENANNETILKICSYALEKEENEEITEEMKEAATVLINPQTRKSYDEARKQVFKEQKEADEERKNREADAKKIAEEKLKKAERKAAKNLEKEKRKIAKNTERRKVKIVETHTDNLTTDRSKKASNYLFKKYGIKGIAALIIAGAIFYGAWNKDTIKDKIKTTFAKDNEDTNYDDALSTVSLNEVEAKDAIEEEIIAEDSYDLSTTFTDPTKEGEVQTRAIAINNYFRANNYHEISNDEIANQIKFINGSYQGEAYDIQDSILTTFRDFASTIGQNDTYISGVSEEENYVGLGLDAFLVDNSPNKKIVIEVAEAFQNLLASKTAQEQVDAANKFLSLEYELMLGLKQNNNGETINFELLSSSEGFVTGLMFQLGNTICPSILKLDENGKITYINNNGKETTIKYEDLQNYYNPESNEEIDYENAWAKYCADLITTAKEQNITKKLN